MKKFNDEYFDNHNKRVLEDSIEMFEYALDSLEGEDVLIDNIPIRAYITNTLNPLSDSKEERTISVKIEDAIDRGSYIAFEDENWIAISDIDNHKSYKMTKIKKCNQSLYIKGWDKPQPCFITNDAYGNKLLLDSDILSMSDEKCKITVQENEITRKILKNTRFMFANSEHGIFKVFSIDVVYQKGLITLICKKDTYKEGIDDLENNIAGQVEVVEDNIPKEDLVIYGEDTIKLGNTEEYTIGSDVAITWSINDDTVCTIIEEGGNYCKIKALKKDALCILTAKINGTVVNEKLIATTR